MSGSEFTIRAANNSKTPDGPIVHLVKRDIFLLLAERGEAQNGHHLAAGDGWLKSAAAERADATLMWLLVAGHCTAREATQAEASI